MKVKCIDNDYSNISNKIKPIFIVGEAVPELGKEYTVEREVYFDNHLKGYMLKEFDYSAYNLEIAFKSSRFEVIEGDGFEEVFDAKLETTVRKKTITIDLEQKTELL